MPTSLQFALSNPTAGMEDAFNHWYGGEHLTHGVQTPGVLAGQRFRRAGQTPWPGGKHDYLMIWEFDDPKYALEQLAAVKGGDDMPISPAIDMNTVQPPTMWIRASVRNAGRVATDTAQRKAVVLALVNAVEGEDEQLAGALLRGGLADLADLPGVIAADFLTLADEQIRGNARKYKYALLIELADEAAGLAALKQPLAAIAHLDSGRWLAELFRPLGDRLTAAEAAASKS